MTSIQSDTARAIHAAAIPISASPYDFLHSFLRRAAIKTIGNLFDNSDLDQISSQSALEFISGNIHSLSEESEFWQVGLSQLVLVKEGDEGVLKTAFLMMSLGAKGSWRAKLKTRLRCYLGVHCLSIGAGTLSCHSDGTVAHVEFVDDTGQHIKATFYKCSNHWTTASDVFPSCLIQIENRAVVATCARSNQIEQELSPDMKASSTSVDEAKARASGALASIRRVSEDYFDWVTFGVRGVQLVSSPTLDVRSGSSPAHFGLIYVTEDIGNWQLATLLVHEAAHQHLISLNLMHALFVDSPNLYYSSFKKQNRPLFKVLMALHAAVNMERFTKAALVLEPSDIFLRRENASLATQIDEMSRSISDAPELTTTGRTFLKRLLASGIERRSNFVH